MAKARQVKGEWGDLAEAGGRVTVHVRPAARGLSLTRDDQGLQIAVPEGPVDGKANHAVQKALAQALGIAPSRLTLIAGDKARIKTFAIR